MRRARSLLPVAAAALGLALLACSGDDGPTAAPTAEGEAAASPASLAAAPALVQATAAPVEARPAPALVDLVQADGSAFDLGSLQGRPTLVFFGYTHCPDVCPATMGELFGVFEEEPGTQAVFVSVDPERDTPEFLTEWTKYLPDRLHAVTGSPGAIRRAADAWGVRYARVETTSTEGYTMSHTADLYLLDEDGRWVRTYPFGTKAAQIVADLRTMAAT